MKPEHYCIMVLLFITGVLSGYLLRQYVVWKYQPVPLAVAADLPRIN